MKRNSNNLRRFQGLLALLLMLCSCRVALAGNLYIDSGVAPYYIETWAVGGLPVEPNYEWRFASGVAFDQTAGVYTNYGQTALATGLTDWNAPSLAEGLLAPHQSAAALNGTDDALYISDNTALRPGANDFGVLVWTRWTTVTPVTVHGIFGKFYTIGNLREWILGCSTINEGGFLAYISSDGSTVNRKMYETNADFNDGKWHLIGFTWISDVLVVYADGVVTPVTLSTDAAITEVYQGTAVPAIGAWHSGTTASTFFPGDVAWAGYWQGVGTPTGTQVAAIYAAMTPTGSTALPYPSIQGAVRQANNLGATTLFVTSGFYQETLEIVHDSLTITALSNAFGSRPVLFGANLIAASGVDAIAVKAKTTVNYLDIRGYPSGRGVVDTTNYAGSGGSLIDHLTIDSVLVGARANLTSHGVQFNNLTIDGESIVGSKGIQWVSGADADTILYTYNCAVSNVDTGFSKYSGTGTWTANYNNFWGIVQQVRFNIAAGANDIAFDPRFTSAATLDYRLLRQSKLIDKGTAYSSTVVFLGPFPDIGAWETWAGSKAIGGTWGRQIEEWGRK